ncbi:hypothetical protein ASB1_02150 [Helicobacter heilmannii]|uniref:glycosyltransferase n=1 Tax=Helicobacter heilmannii TaxID=35817 RepID=UPI0022021E97|nr:glycosyltransferase [Helicobacter heilmannii]BDQ26539.1 hypothetical protein ASB1_02150 [Helicobacter heilmannii]
MHTPHLDPTPLATYTLCPNDVHGGLRVQGHFKQKSQDKPLVSVLMATLNSQEFLEQTLTSIFVQDYPHLEIIVIDGGSNDQTLETLKRHSDRIDYFLSQKDSGIAEAFNKGVRLALGDYINFQGDGDGYLNHKALSQALEGVKGDW